eukprot:GHVQ01004018.1.p1 GENE.GHVQ01004018.1~~GHVQ01004018.1.p1  ORF type:complete len:159 (-),score=17.27 GHVQ01004018.1:262-738(-)
MYCIHQNQYTRIVCPLSQRECVLLLRLLLMSRCTDIWLSIERQRYGIMSPCCAHAAAATNQLLVSGYTHQYNPNTKQHTTYTYEQLHTHNSTTECHPTIQLRNHTDSTQMYIVYAFSYIGSTTTNSAKADRSCQQQRRSGRTGFRQDWGVVARSHKRQ